MGSKGFLKGSRIFKSLFHGRLRKFKRLGGSTELHGKLHGSKGWQTAENSTTAIVRRHYDCLLGCPGAPPPLQNSLGNTRRLGWGHATTTITAGHG